MKKLEKKLKNLIEIRAKYNEAIYRIKNEKRRTVVQKWANDVNVKILEVEKQLLEDAAFDGCSS